MPDRLLDLEYVLELALSHNFRSLENDELGTDVHKGSCEIWDEESDLVSALIWPPSDLDLLEEDTQHVVSRCRPTRLHLGFSS